MKKVCSWCRRDMGTVSIESNFENAITHGICAECLDSFFGPHQVRLLDFIDGLKVAVVVVDVTGSVTSANKLAQSQLNKELPDIKGFKYGDVFECAYAALPGGCGNTIHCDGCTIRHLVMDTFQTGKSHLKEPAYLIHGLPEENQEIQCLISTEKVKDVVLLRIDKFEKPGEQGKGAIAERRLHKRLDCEDHCFLHQGDSFYSGLIKNISMGGALVRFSYPLTVGDNCKVSMNGGLLCKFICEVVRVEAPNVALRFIDIDTCDDVTH
jgi:hypothetical protein